MGVRLLALSLCALGIHAGRYGFLASACGLFALLRVPRQRLVLEIALAAVALGLYERAPYPLVVVGGAVLVALLAPESRALPLNGLDRYFVAQDYDGTRLTSQHYVDTHEPWDRTALEKALDTVMVEVPMLRTFVREAPFGMERFVARRPWFSARELVHWTETMDATDPQFLNAPLDLERAPPVRLVHSRRADGGFRLCLTVHHSAVDGEGGLVLLDRFVRRYNEALLRRPAEPLPDIPETKRFREIFWPRGLGWIIRAIRRHVHPFGKMGVQHAHLLDDETPLRSDVHHHPVRIEPDLWARLKAAATPMGVSRNDLLVCAALRAADAIRKARGRDDRPYRLMLPSNLRSLLGVPPSLGNCVGSLRVPIEAADLRRSELPALVSKTIRSGRGLDDAVETPVNLGVMDAVMPVWLFRAILRKLDRSVNAFFFSFLFSSMRPPPGLAMPEGLTTERMFVGGALTRRPGFGLALTQFGGEVTAVIQYLSPIIRHETALDFARCFVDEAEKLARGGSASDPDPVAGGEPHT